jgi:hypothetical protein
MKPEEHAERTLEIAGWPVRLTSYKLGAEFHCVADNVSPGACLARTVGATREEAKQKALTRAESMLSRTRRNAVPASDSKLAG